MLPAPGDVPIFSPTLPQVPPASRVNAAHPAREGPSRVVAAGHSRKRAGVLRGRCPGLLRRAPVKPHLHTWSHLTGFMITSFT